jgi:hypothetical protein
VALFPRSLSIRLTGLALISGAALWTMVWISSGDRKASIRKMSGRMETVTSWT